MDNRLHSSMEFNLLPLLEQDRSDERPYSKYKPVQPKSYITSTVLSHWGAGKLKQAPREFNFAACHALLIVVRFFN